MISYAYARTHAYAYSQTDIRICGQIIIRVVYNEPNAISPSCFNQNEKSAFNDAQLYFTTGYYIYLCYVILYAHIRTELVNPVWMMFALLHFSISTRSHHSYALNSNH